MNRRLLTLPPLLRAAVLQLVCLGLMAGAASAAQQPRGAPPRVAIMNFVCEEDSYRSSANAIDLTAQLQALLAAETNYSFIEREELDRAAEELTLATFGTGQRAAALQLGRWAKADWGVFGRVSTNSLNGRSVDLEVVDLDHATVLASATQKLAPSASKIFEPVSSDALRLANSVREVLQLAARAKAEERNKPYGALLFLSPEGGAESPFDLHRAFRDLSEARHSFQLTEFLRDTEAIDESELALSGLTDAEPNAWQRLADFYLWGNYAARENTRWDEPSRAWVKENVVTVSLHFWDGHEPPRLLQVQLTNPPSPGPVSERIVEIVADLASKIKRTEPTPNETRSNLSNELLKEAERLAALGIPFINSPEGRRKWLEIAHLSETACFFAPDNRSVREFWLGIRFGSNASMGTKQPFTFAVRRSQAWKHYVDQFGFQGSRSKPDDIALEYLRSAWQPLEMFNESKTTGIPPDSGIDALHRWQRRLTQDFCNRLLRLKDSPVILSNAFNPDFLYASLRMNGDEFVLEDAQLRQKCIDLLWPYLLQRKIKGPPLEFDMAYLTPLRKHFEQLGRPADAQQLLNDLEEAGLRAERPKIRVVKLPRFAQLEPGSPEAPGAPLRPPPITFDLSVRNGRFKETVVRTQPGATKAGTMVFHGGKLYLLLSTAEAIPEMTAGTQVERELLPLSQAPTRLWCLDPKSSLLARVAGPLATNSVSGLVSEGDTLWISTSDYGVAAWNTKTGAARWFGPEAGLATNQSAIVIAGGAKYALGWHGELRRLSDDGSRWEPVQVESRSHFGGELARVAGNQNELLFFNGSLVSYDFSRHSWTAWDATVSAVSPLQGLGLVRALVADDAGRLWVAADSGLHRIEPNEGTVQSSFLNWNIPPERDAWSPIPASVPFGVPQSMVAQLARMNRLPPHMARVRSDEFLQTLSMTRERLAELRKTSPRARNPYRPASRVPQFMRALATHGQYLWVLDADGRLLLFDPLKRAWVNEVRLPGNGLSLAVAGDQVWAAIETANSTVELHAFDLAEWTAIPLSQWTPDNITESDLTEKIAGLTPLQQAFCYVLWDEPAKAVEILHANDSDSSGAQGLFVLSLAYDPCGLNQPEQAHRFAQELLSNYPDSIYTLRLLKTEKLRSIRARALARKASRPQTSTTLQGPRGPGMSARPTLNSGPWSRPSPPPQPLSVSELVSDYDADADGALDIEELELVCELEPDRLRGGVVFGIAQADKARNLLQRFDRNRDGKLDPGELASLGLTTSGPIINRMAFTNRAGAFPSGFRPGASPFKSP